MDKQLKAGIMMTYAMGLVQVLVNIFFTGALVRFLGEVEFGLYVLMGSLAAYVTVFDFGLNNTISRYVAKYRHENNKEKESGMLFISFAFYAVIMVVILLVGLLVMNHLEFFVSDIPADSMRLARTLFLLLVVNLAITLPLSSFSAILVGYEQFVYTRTVSILRVIAMPLLSLPFLYLGGNSVTVVLVTTVTNIAAGIANAVIAVRKHHIRIRPAGFDKGIVRELFFYSSAVFLGVIADQVFYNTGNVVLGIARGPAEVSAFGVSIQLLQYLIAVTAAFSGVYLPRATQIAMSRPGRETLTRFFSGSSRPLNIILLFILGGYIALGREFVYFWFDSKLSDVYWVSLLIIIPTMWTLTRTLGVSIMQSMNRHSFRSKLLLIKAAVNCGLCFLLVRNYGYYGIAVSYAVTILITNIVLDFYYERAIGLSVVRYTLRLWPVAVSGAVAAVLVALSYRFAGYSVPVFLLRGVVYTVLFMGLVYRIYLNPDERNKVRGTLRRLLRRSAGKVEENG